jgi:antitoxin YefM
VRFYRIDTGKPPSFRTRAESVLTLLVREWSGPLGLGNGPFGAESDSRRPLVAFVLSDGEHRIEDFLRPVSGKQGNAGRGVVVRPRPVTALHQARMYNIMYMRRWAMKVMSMSESRANYAATLDSVINDQEEVIITRPGGENVVMLPQREYESMRETLYLMASPANRLRISRSIEQLNAARGRGHELIDADEDDV